jgi:hypothetical protein
MAGMLGRFIARVVSRAAAASYREAEGRTEAPTREADPHREWAEEPQLTPS